MQHRILTPTSDDAPWLAELAQQTFREAFTGRIKDHNLEAYIGQALMAEHFRAALADPNVTVRVIDVDGVHAGYMKLVAGAPQEGVTAGSPVELQKLYFHKGYRGHGLGALLLELAIEESRTAGHDGMWLDVWVENVGAINFYEKHGFKIVHSLTHMIGDNEQHHLIMARAL